MSNRNISIAVTVTLIFFVLAAFKISNLYEQLNAKNEIITQQESEIRECREVYGKNYNQLELLQDSLNKYYLVKK